MDNSISLYTRTGFNPYVRAQQSTQRLQSAPETGTLSAGEQKMIAEFFPASPSMSMKLYGPGRNAQSVAPASIGGKLDLRG